MSDTSCCASCLLWCSQSKWVAEQLVLGAQRRGLPASVVRLGRIGGSSRTGAFNEDDFLVLFLKGGLGGSVRMAGWVGARFRGVIARRTGACWSGCQACPGVCIASLHVQKASVAGL